MYRVLCCDVDVLTCSIDDVAHGQMFNIEDGIPNKELQEAMTAFASIHAGSWNDSYCIPIAEGGTNHYINDGNQMPVLWQEFGIGGWEEYKKILTDEVRLTCTLRCGRCWRRKHSSRATSIYSVYGQYLKASH